MDGGKDSTGNLNKPVLSPPSFWSLQHPATHPRASSPLHLLHTKYPKIKPFSPQDLLCKHNTKEDGILQGACILQGGHFEVTNQGEQKVVGT